MEKIAGKFYKYRELDVKSEKSKKRLREILVDLEIYYAKPSALNDPFDCRPASSAPPAPELRKYIPRLQKSALNKRGIKVSRKDRDAGVTKTVLGLTDEINRTEAVFQSLDNNTGVFCTSMNNHSNLQWAYYADSHRGICIEYEVTAEEKFAVTPVNYTDNRPLIKIVPFLLDDEYRVSITTTAITTKSKDWEHEAEARFILPESGKHRIRPAMLTGIIFGLNVDKATEKYVRKLVAKSEASPTLYRCRIDNASFQIHIDPI